jgi:dsDNA-specific endonuclease/ATPase MutS2
MNKEEILKGVLKTYDNAVWVRYSQREIIEDLIKETFSLTEKEFQKKIDEIKKDIEDTIKFINDNKPYETYALAELKDRLENIEEIFSENGDNNPKGQVRGKK